MKSQRGSASLFCLLTALTLGPPGQADAYLIATSGIEIALHQQAPNLWEMTLESDRPITDASFDLNQGFASMDYTAAAPCFGNSNGSSGVAVCKTIDESLTALPALLFTFGILLPTHPSLFTGIGNPVVLGLLTTTGPLTIGVNPPEWGTSFAGSPAAFGVAGFNNFKSLAEGLGPPDPLTFVVVSEPMTSLVPEPTAALLLGAALAALLALRRGSGPPA